MFVVLALALAAQSIQIRIGSPDDKARADSIRRQAVRDSIRYEVIERARDRQRRTPRRIPLTPELARTAFRDVGARTLLLKARDARLRQDSALLSYDASAYQRLSVGIGFRATGRQRLLFRTENASRVRWSRSGGVWVDLKGQRSVFPSARDGEAEVDAGEMSPIPYFPGREALWIGSGTARAEVDERELVHPIALGAEAYYRYAAGDSLTITLPGGRAIQLRELRIEPRRPEWRLSVGSFWFDDMSGQLVRAVYRLAVPLDIWRLVDEETKRDIAAAESRGGNPTDDEVPGWVKGTLTPMQASLEAVTIEYGLYGGRFWLPRSQYAEGWARASFMRIPFRMEEGFTYASVNGTDSLPPLPSLLTRRQLRDSLFGYDSTRWSDLSADVRAQRIRALAQADSARRAQAVQRRADECATSGHFTRVESRNENALRIAVRIPCDSTVLATSPDLPPSIYDPGEELFGSAARDEMLRALDFSLQPVWAPLPVRLTYGVALSRYNRVEGFSTALSATQQLGRGYSWDAIARLGTGDWIPNLELGGVRTNGRLTWRLAGYHRLAVANDDWGSPLSFGASLGALLYGRDEGYYYRTTGLEVTHTATRGGALSTRFFVERQHDAESGARFNVSRALGGGSEFFPNIQAVKATVAGVALRDQRSAGLDPEGWRLSSDSRLEGGWVSSTRATVDDERAYVRAAAEVTVTRGFGSRFAAALTAGGGVSDGAPMPQRGFFLGGAQTVRGQVLGAAGGLAGGEAYWLGRLEVGRSNGVMRPVVFGDVGWAGARRDWREPGRPISGAGVGASLLDGLVRLDLSHGISPRCKPRLDLYVEGRF